MLSTIFDINNIALNVPLAGYGTDTYAISWLELWATITGLLSVIGARMNKIWWYPVGILNSVGFIALFYQIQLYSDLLLNIGFICMSIYGWWIWTRKLNGRDEYPIRNLGFPEAILLTVGMAACIYLLGFHIDYIFNGMAQSVALVLGTTYTHTPAAMPYWDATTTVMSVVAMYLLAKRYVESWVLWVIVDIICVGLYLYKGVIAMSAEYALFLLNAIYGLHQWNVIARKESSLMRAD